jgi:hypothetical protein
MPDEPTAPADTHCEYCGLAYDEATRAAQAAGHGERARVPRQERESPNPRGEGEITHCEYCGAEYPVPDDRH